MTYGSIARPEDYAEAHDLAPLAPDANVAALNRIAVALEQIALALLDRPQAPVAPPQAIPQAFAPLPPVAAPAGAVCPIHNLPWKVVPAGVSSKTGAAYESFRACSIRGCDQRPPR